MGLDEDSILRPYRRCAGLSAPGCDLGGRYSSGDTDRLGIQDLGEQGQVVAS
jgi:hypothetical protein